MAEHGLDHLQVRAGEGQCGCAVPEVVQADWRQVFAANQPDELAGDLLRGDRPPVGLAKK